MSRSLERSFPPHRPTTNEVGPSRPVPYYTPGFDNSGEEFDYVVFFRRLWARRLQIIGTVALATIAAAVVVHFLPRHYEADALVVVGNRNGDAGMGSRNSGNGNGAAAATVTPPDSEAVQTEVQILQSPELAAEIIRNLKLGENPEFNPDMRDSETDAAEQLSQTLSNFLARLHVTVKGSSRVIDVNFDASNPKLAATIANALVDQYAEDQIEMRTSTIERQSQWLQGRITELQTQSANDEAAVASYQTKAGLYSTPGGAPLSVKEMSDISDQLTKARSDRQTLEDQLRQLKASGGSSSDATADTLDSPVMRSLRTQQATLQAEAALNAQNLGPNHPKTKALNAQLGALGGQMHVEARKIVSAAEHNVDVAKKREADLGARLDALKQTVSNTNDASVTLGGLQRQAEADKLVLSNYMTRFKELGAATEAAAQRPDSQILSRARPPLRPSKPQGGLLIAIAACVGLVGSCGFVIFRDKVDRSFRTIEDLESNLGVKGLGLIPETPAARSAPVTLSQYGSGSSYREAVKAIYTILFTLFGQRAKVTVVTSAVPGEGKTTLALSLATMAAQAGHRTLLIDGDFWRGGASKALGVQPQSRGLIDILEHRANSSEELISDCGSSLDILPPGHMGRNSGLIRSENLADLLQVLGARYEFIIIDSPPVLAVAESLILAAQADETILAVRWGRTTRGTAALAVKRLREAGAKIVGATLTRVDERRHTESGHAESAYFSRDVVGYYASSGALSVSTDGGRDPRPGRLTMMRRRIAASTFNLATNSPLARIVGRSIVPRRKAPKIQPYDKPRLALLVLDMQDEFTSPDGWYAMPHNAASRLLDSVNDVTKKAREFGVFVAYAQQEFGRGPAKLVPRTLLGPARGKLRDGRIDPRVRTVSGHSFTKPLADAFSNPKLDAFLRSRQVNHIFLMGVDGAISVGQTARSALQRGYGVTFISDGIFTVLTNRWNRELTEFAVEKAFPITSQDFRDLFDGLSGDIRGKGIITPPTKPATGRRSVTLGVTPAMSKA